MEYLLVLRLMEVENLLRNFGEGQTEEEIATALCWSFSEYAKNLENSVLNGVASEFTRDSQNFSCFIAPTVYSRSQSCEK
jgi:hypothetical protein